jgi:5'-nucleotidase
MFDFVARRSASRACATQVQIAGARIVINCKGCTTQEGKPCSDNDECPSNECAAGKCVINACAEHIYIGSTTKTCSSDADCNNKQNACDLGRLDQSGLGRCLQEIDSAGSYELATSTYLAGGGSGFAVLKKNTTQLDTKVQQRDALIDWVRGGKPCGFDESNGTDDGLRACSQDTDCAGLAGYVCACPQNAGEAGNGQCTSTGACPSGAGRCVVAQCRQGVAEYYRALCQNPSTLKSIASCTTSVSPCQLGGEQCKYLGCIDRNLGSFADGRVLMVGK